MRFFWSLRRLDQPSTILRSGLINNTSNHGYINVAGNQGYYWSSVVNNNSSAYDFYFNTSTTFNPSNNYPRHYGMTIRLVAWFQS